MQCPVCDTKLRPIERNGVEIDICPGCKGIWLDRGELEKIVQLESSGEPSLTPVPRTDPRGSHHRDDDDDDHDRERSHDRHDRRDERGYRDGQQRPRRGSWFSNLLENIGGGGDD